MINKLVILIVIVLGVIGVAQLVRLNELSRKHSGRKEENIPNRDNKLNANLMLVFMIFFYAGFIWLMLKFGWTGRGPAASTHGVGTDWLLNLNFVIIITVFFLTNTLLFVFAWKYVKRPGVKAVFFAHSNKLEAIWTVIPALVLAVIIILGLRTWNDITDESAPEAERVEVFSWQFAWKARYSGMDNTLGAYDYKLTTAENEFALINKANIDAARDSMSYGQIGSIKVLEETLNNPNVIMSVEEREKLTNELAVKQRLHRLLTQMGITHNDSLDVLASNDFFSDTLVLLKGQNYEFTFRSKDVIHSAYFPHFRAQMNTVPGMETRMKFQPIYTTEEMRKEMNDEDFEYILMCNKICGGSHYNMKMPVRVMNAEQYYNWKVNQTTYNGKTYFGYDADPANLSAAEKAEQMKKREALLESYKAIEASLDTEEK
ncbi:cytochrome c oxidase subunit 2 [Lishizhenia tianjinensis]|uniref:cytochrome-c oxidase n=1 Tax=Lishizhenia tianjinensis TaxID=477690 RepID=A0A1I7B434_9FLAO|nr:cytochrome c oxidase subunit II [Lishizhenia tianjinensis]SFT81983.1 cytochrome c oxidase subunit 2 [Lishizhenia tianjinensis]